MRSAGAGLAIRRRVERPAALWALCVIALLVALAAGAAPAAAAAAVQATGEIDLEIENAVVPEQVGLGGTVTWTVVVTNSSPVAATGITVADTMPAAVGYVSHSGAGEFDAASGVWTVGEVAAGESASIDIVTTVIAVGTAVNVAEVATADQEDVDSVPGDGEGDDLDEAAVEVSAVAASAIIGDTVWQDEDADGTQDAGESGIPGAVVVLTETAGGAVATTTTNVDGLYLFSALDAGSYRVEIDPSSVAASLSLTTAAFFDVTLGGNDAFLTADFGLAAQELPATGFDPIPVTAAGLVLLLLGAVVLELTWPERQLRRSLAS